MQRFLFLRRAAGLALLGVLAACAPVTPVPVTPSVAVVPKCTPAAAGDVLTGNWLSVSTQRGLAGALRTLYTLGADGTMKYAEQVKRPRTPSQGLYEAGCWAHEGGTLVLRTLESNGVPVNLADPIYVNRYRVDSVNASELRMRGPDGRAVRARRMSAGYRLPF